MNIETHSFSRTYKLGRKFGENISKNKYSNNFIFTLDGELGSGKTAFVSGLAAGLGVDGPVLSPSFTIVKEYKTSGYSLFHIDLYRLFSDSDLMSFDFYEYLSSDMFVMAIEWANKFGDMNYLPPLPTVNIKILSDAEKDENFRAFKFKFKNFDSEMKKAIASGVEK